MTLIITEPIKTVNGLLTQALAGRSQLLYNMQRQGILYGSAASGAGGVAQLIMDDTSQFTIGQNTGVYGEYNGFFEVLDIAANTSIDIDTPFVASGSGGLLPQGFEPNYRIAVDIQDDASVDLFEKTFR